MRKEMSIFENAVSETSLRRASLNRARTDTFKARMFNTAVDLPVSVIKVFAVDQVGGDYRPMDVTLERAARSFLPWRCY